MLNFMSSSQIASLFIGIAFSVLAVAGIILVVKYSKAINSFSKSLAISLICPFIAYVSWMFLILSYVDGFKKDELLNLIISILLGVVLIVTVMIVARTLYLKHYAEFEEDAIAPENTDEVISNQNIVEVNGENSQEEAKEVEMTEETEVAETEETEEIAETEENETVETEESEEVAETEETENKDIDSKLVDALILTQILDEKEQEREQENNNEQIESEKNEENEVGEEISNAEEVSQETEQEEIQENVEETSEDEQKIVEETEMPIENVEEAQEAEQKSVEDEESVKEDDGLEDVEIESNSENNNNEEPSQEEKEIDDFMDEIRALLDEKDEPKHTLTQDEIDDLEFEKYLDSLKKRNEDEEN